MDNVFLFLKLLINQQSFLKYMALPSDIISDNIN